MVGILLHGENHFIVRGTSPSREVALALARAWSVIQIGMTTPPALDGWYIVSREFPENLERVVTAPGNGTMSSASNDSVFQIQK